MTPGGDRGTPRRILYRIILPFTLLFAATSILAWLVSAYLMGRFLDDRLEQQMERVTKVISHSSYILNPAVLRQLRDVVNAEIIVMDRNGRTIVSTFADQLDYALPADILGRLQPEQPLGIREIERQGTKYRTVFHPLHLPGPTPAVLSLWMPVDEIERLTRQIVLVMGGITSLGVVAMSLVGYLIARTITAPVEKLVAVAETVAAGDLEQRAVIASQDEIGLLAESFNTMVDKLVGVEQRLIESEKLAVVGQMAAGLAHEVRNPLTSIKMLVQVLLGRMRGDPGNAKMLASLLAEIDRLDRIIGQIVDRTRSGDLQRQPVCMNTMLTEVLQLADESLKSGNISVTVRADREMPRVPADPEKIKQVFWNLLVNARDAMPRGGSLAVSIRQSGPNSLELAFEDTGTGIGSRDPEELFRSFVTTKPEGLGLGLSMSRKIIERHGGALTLENRDEGGARARITLPISDTSLSPNASKAWPSRP